MPRRLLLTIAPICVAVTVGCGSDQDCPSRWVIETVDDEGTYPSIAVDAAGAVHISYFDLVSDSLRHATNESGAWVLETVVEGADLRSSLALDAAGAAHIACYDTTDPSLSLRYATNASGRWVIEDIGTTGRAPSLALDADGAAHVAYYDTTDRSLRHATNASGAWAFETIDEEAGCGWSLALDADGAVYVANCHSNGSESPPRSSSLGYVTNRSGKWAWGTIQEEAWALLPFLALDAHGAAHISYLDDRDMTSRRDVTYATNETGVWEIERVGAFATAFAPLAVDATGAAHVAHDDEPNGYLHYATNQSGEWVLEEVDTSGAAGFFPSLAVDSAGAAHIGYVEADLRYATNRGAPEEVDSRCLE